MELLKVDGKINVKKLAAGVLVPVIGGSIVGWLANKNTKEQYQKLRSPKFAPPAAVFPVAWTTLYGMMGLARYRAEEKIKVDHVQTPALPAYDVQLGLNFLWSFLFFKWGLRGTALVEMVILFGAIALAGHEFNKVDKTAGKLMIPYMGWVMYALALNYSFWKLNKE